MDHYNPKKKKTDFEIIKERLVPGVKLRCVSHGGKPFEGKDSTVESINGYCVYLTGYLASGQRIRSFIEMSLLGTARLTEDGFELWPEGEPEFGYEWDEPSPPDEA